jgi:hypothetical protein
MVPEQFISIDQNSHSLWDTVPKLAALAVHGVSGTHYIEDIDTAFTRRGAAPGDNQLALVPERMYRGGTSDWGASLFYTDFLGRNPLDVRDLEPYTGMTTKALARALDCSVDELYDRYAVSDNWQLVGASYVGDELHHRVIGDLTVTECAPFITQLIDHAEKDVLKAFPDRQARQRSQDWFTAEKAKLDQLLGQMSEADLPRFYAAWMGLHVKAPCRMTSAFFEDIAAAAAPDSLLDAFLRDYDQMTILYNEAVQETDVGLNPLAKRHGELPFFVVWHKGGRMTRTAALLQDGVLISGDGRWKLQSNGRPLPLDAMKKDGVLCVAGKAVLLVLQARLRPQGAPLVLPYKGSLYMPAVHRFEQKLRAAGRLHNTSLHPVWRVKFGFLTRFGGAAATVRLPEYLQTVFSSPELGAASLAAQLPEVVCRAEERLRRLMSNTQRQTAVAARDPRLAAEIRQLEEQQRELAGSETGRAQASELWDRVKHLRKQQLVQLVDDIVRDLHIARLDYWDSRGALLPWCIALGGDSYYQNLLEEANFYAETEEVNAG